MSRKATGRGLRPPAVTFKASLGAFAASIHHQRSTPTGTGTPPTPPKGERAKGHPGLTFICVSAGFGYSHPRLASPAACRPTHPPGASQAWGSPPAPWLDSAAGSRGAIWQGEPGSPLPRRPSRLPAERRAGPTVSPHPPRGDLGIRAPPPSFPPYPSYPAAPVFSSPPPACTPPAPGR